jgi:polysaccharide export outer membrane protein
MIIRLLCALFFAGLSSLAQSAIPAGNAEYKLASGDVISVSVFGEKDLSFEKIGLTDAGTFSYPFIGEVQAKGRTAAEIEQTLISKLKGDYLVNPKVSVSVVQYRDFFISGEVTRPGGYPFQPGLTLGRAVALAGGFTERASDSKITIAHDQGNSKPVEKASLDTPLLPGDTITVPEGFF